MAKGLAPVFFTACGVVVAGVVGYTLYESKSSIKEPQIVTSESLSGTVSAIQTKDDEAKQEVVEQEVAKLDTPSEDASSNASLQNEPELETPVEPIAVLPVQPSFGLVRVERDGSAVIAGEGPANEMVELIDGQKKLAETKVTASGEFVFVLDEPLTPGTHELFMRVTPEEGDPIQSSSFAFVDVPKPKTIGEVTVLLAETGKPSQVLQKPNVPSVEVEAQPEEVEVQPKKVVTAKAEETVSLAKPVEVVEGKEEVVDEVAQPIVEDIKKVEPSTTKPVEVSSLAPVLIEAADVENGKLFIAGTGESLTSINIYLENDLLGSAKVAENGTFLFEGSVQLEAGRHNIRADMTKGGASVLARAEVTLVHEPVVASVTPQEEEPKVEVGPVEAPESSAVETDEVEEKVEIEQAASIETPEVEAQEEIQGQEALEAEKKEIQTGSAVIIRRGDSLWTVARRNYGAGIRYTTIFDANRDQVRNPNKIFPGQVLKIPEAEYTVQ